MKLIVNGSGGRMGRALIELIGRRHAGRFEVVCAADPANGGSEPPRYASLRDFGGRADCIIDFSRHDAVFEVFDYAAGTGTPVVEATTGHTAGEEAAILAAARSLPVFHAPNLSLGAALAADLALAAARSLPEAEIDLIETHHDRKTDCPGGTALDLAAKLARTRQDGEVVHGAVRGARNAGSVCVHSVRRGDLIGTHEVIFTTPTQTVRVVHEARDRAAFAEGALAAAQFIVGRRAGIYTMKDLIDNENMFY